ncbi:RHS repeat-associated core domain-containing protein [Chryseobacterium sp. JV558]|uniref:RHS repeat-associated core domain-containing protein n=1 Tax=Chryseobacterium sp. JV558 TaxID=2663236 RepID=UPI00299E8912|nr:RHS repeat-associated core domain-containing protein [Chryseobacterium sp. JV558]
MSGPFSSSNFGSFYSYKYNGKELQETGMYDYGARMLMPDLGRWGAMDAMSEKYNAWSPYNYAINNPVMVIDPDGNDISYSGEAAQQAFRAYVATMSTSSETSGSLGESFSRPMFQFPKGQEEYYQKTYPAFYNFVKNQLPNIIKDSNFLQAFMDITGMSQEEVTKAFTYGQGPTLHDWDIDFTNGQYDYAMSHDKDDLNKISISNNVLNWFEKANKDSNSIEGITNLFFMSGIIGHEGAHWGHNIKGNSSMNDFLNIFNGEHGEAFEFRIFKNDFKGIEPTKGYLQLGQINAVPYNLTQYVKIHFNTLSKIFNP